MSDYEGQVPPTSIEKAEHIEVNGVPAKRVVCAGWDGTNLQDLNVTSGGSIILAGLEIPTHDYVGLSYTGPDLTGVIYKTGGSGGTTVATLTLGYDGSDNLITVAKT